jgi:hypothetical protein
MSQPSHHSIEGIAAPFVAPRQQAYGAKPFAKRAAMALGLDDDTDDDDAAATAQTLKRSKPPNVWC